MKLFCALTLNFFPPWSPFMLSALFSSSTLPLFFLFLLFFFFVHIYVQVEVRRQLQVLFLRHHHLIFLRQGLTNLTKQVRLAGNKPQGLPVSTLLMLGLWVCTTMSRSSLEFWAQVKKVPKHSTGQASSHVTLSYTFVWTFFLICMSLTAEEPSLQPHVNS